MNKGQIDSNFAVGQRVTYRSGELAIVGTIEAIADAGNGEPGALTLLTDELEWVVLRLTESADVQPRYPTIH